jgi:hypothetical protein
VLIAALMMVAAATVDPHPPAWVGTYDGSQMELATGLQLRADGRFAFAMSYGALDEEGQGSWSLVDRRIVLHGDPVTPPRFVLTGQSSGAPGALRISLAAPPGLNPGLFRAIEQFADGSTDDAQFDLDGVASFPLQPGRAPTVIRVVIAVIELAGPPIAFDRAKGTTLAFRFESNDIGKVDVRDTPLAIDGGDLVLERHGRTIRYRRTAAP